MLKTFKSLRFLLLVFLLVLVFLVFPKSVSALDPIGSWQQELSLPYSISSHTSIALPNNLFVLSGANTSILPNEILATITDSGDLSPWSINKQSPFLFWHSQVVKNNFIYLLGGATYPPTNSSNLVYVANISSNEEIGPWSTLSSLPIKSSLGGATLVDNRIYYAGGFEDPGGVLHDEVYFSNINSDGTIGSWQIAGTLPNKSKGFGLIENNGYLLFIGGRDSNNNYSSASFFAKINPDGTIGSWQSQTLPEPLYRASFLKINSTLISIGGSGPNGVIDKVYYADLNSDGSIESWNLSVNSLPSPVSSASVATVNGYLYLIGGYNTGYLSSVYKTQISNLPPQPQSNVPVVLVPGFGGSWSTSDIISGGSGGSWKKTPFIKVYDNIKSTFIDNGGYVEGDDYFEFYYDWRKPADDLADSLNNYINSIVLAGKPAGTKVNLIGHSFGGVVSKAYGQKHGTDKINKLVTSGSPHEGAISAWQGWSGAEVGDRWSWQWIALQLYLQIHKGKYSSPVSAIQDLSPSLSNLTPIFDFAKDSNDQVINVTTMNSFNSYLDTLKTSIDAGLKNLMASIAGNENSSNDSIEWVKLGDRSLADRLLGKWSDGRPVSYEYTDNGDLTVLEKSALMADTSQAVVSANHIELMESSVGIQAILDKLGLTNFTPAVSSGSPSRNPALVFFLHSPANIKVTTPSGSQAGYGVTSPMSNSIYSEADKLLIIFDAEDGDYDLEIVGSGSGTYNLDIGQLTSSGEKWSTTEENINTGETDAYTLNFNSSIPKDFPLVDATGKMQLNLARKQFSDLKDYIDSQSFSTAYKRQLGRYVDRLIMMIDRAIAYIDVSNYSRAYRYARAAMTGAYSFRMKVDQLGRSGRIGDNDKARIKAMAHDAGVLSLEGYVVTLDLSGRAPNQTRVGREVDVAEKVKNKVESRIASSGENHPLGLAFSLASKMLDNSRDSVDGGEFARASAQTLLSRLLSLESLKIR